MGLSTRCLRVNDVFELVLDPGTCTSLFIIKSDNQIRAGVGTAEPSIYKLSTTSALSTKLHQKKDRND